MQAMTVPHHGKVVHGISVSLQAGLGAGMALYFGFILYLLGTGLTGRLSEDRHRGAYQLLLPDTAPTMCQSADEPGQPSPGGPQVQHKEKGSADAQPAAVPENTQ